jgi:chromosome segregation ATPase
MDDRQRDANTKLHQPLALSDALQQSPAVDRQRLARQAIRSQATAREYAERQLLRAEQMIQDLGAKLNALRHEKGAALEVARTAQTALVQAERNLRGVEVALIGEKATRERAQRDAQEVRATVHDLRAKLAQANQTVEVLQTQLGQERQVRHAAERSAAQASAVVEQIADAPGDQPVKRRRGRPPGKRDASVARPAAGKARTDNRVPVQWWIEGWAPNT